MLYYILFQYIDTSGAKTRTIDARLVVDLPQTSLAEAQRNLFVRDLVRHAHVRTCYLRDKAYLRRPESLLRELKGTMPSNMHQIKVVYQYKPNSSEWHEFTFYIYLDNSGVTSYLPFKHLDFSCCNEYHAYYEAFKSDLLVCGIPMQTPQYEEGNLVKVCYGAVYELATVEKNASGQLVAVPIGNKQSTIPINLQTNSCIHGFNPTAEMMQILGALWQNAGYNLGGGWYELVLANAQGCNSVVLHIIKRDCSFFLVIDENAEPFYRLEEFRGFDDLQRLVKKIFGYKYKPSLKAQFDIEVLIRKRHSEVLLLMDLPDFIASFNSGDDVELIIAGIVQKYNISYAEAEHYYNICQIGK